jgi:hypothetical protein
LLPGGVFLRFHGCSVRYSIKPTSHGTRPPDRVRLPRQQKKSRLKRIFAILLRPENPAADGPHQPAIAPVQGRERHLIAIGQKAVQKFGIRELVSLPGHQHAANMPEDRLRPRRRLSGRLRRCHRLVSIESDFFPLLVPTDAPIGPPGLKKMETLV